jgi:hypothetical protein
MSPNSSRIISPLELKVQNKTITTTTTQLKLLETKRYNCTYNLYGEELNLFGLVFKFNPYEECFMLIEDSNKSAVEIIQISKVVLDSLNDINKKGYVFQKVLEESTKFIKQIEEHLVSLGYERTPLGSSNNSYTLWYNLIFLNLFYLVCKEIHKLEELNERCIPIDSLDSDLLTDLKTLKSNLQGRLDPYLRFQIQKRGVSIIQNIYNGFDTEYELSDYRKNLNILVSTQLAVQSRTLIKIPLYNSFDISYIHPITSEISSFYKPEVDE